MGAHLTAVRRAAPVLGIAVLGFASASAAYLWWSLTAAVLLGLAACVGSAAALAMLYRSGRPLRFKSVPLYLGLLALIVLYIVGIITARDVALTLTGTDADAVVARTWTTYDSGRKHKTQHHCTVTLSDGTPLPRELGSNCVGRDPGDTLPIVFTPGKPFPPVSGPKSDMQTAGEAQVTSIAALVLLLSIALGSPPKRT
ncbi:hypothetical protein [Actinomadura sp. GTD37]|uniref:hypothetical protein n=1 Tax=Actinomadura sp. GTD37 TaxID=1778030 RepID=UPI0035C02406